MELLPAAWGGWRKRGARATGKDRDPPDVPMELGWGSGGPLGEPPPHLGARGTGWAVASSERLRGPPLRVLAALLSSQLRTGPWGGPGGRPGSGSPRAQGGVWGPRFQPGCNKEKPPSHPAGTWPPPRLLPAPGPVPALSCPLPYLLVRLSFPS